MPKKLDRCVQQVRGQGESEDSAYAICSKSTGIKRKKSGGWTKEKKDSIKYNALKRVIKDFLKEAINLTKIGYVVVDGEDQKMYPIKIFKFEKYPEHQALEQAIQLADQKGAQVHSLKPNGQPGELVWPHETDQISENEEMISILKGQDYATISGLSYRLKECGANVTLSYKNGSHTLMVRRDLLPLVVDSLKNTCDSLGQRIGEELELKHFKKNEKK